MEVHITSKEIARTYERPHRDIIKSIEKLECSKDFKINNFKITTYLSCQNKEFECYELTRNGWFMLVMGFRGKKADQCKESIIGQFNDMYGYLSEGGDND